MAQPDALVVRVCSGWSHLPGEAGGMMSLLSFRENSGYQGSTSGSTRERCWRDRGELLPVSPPPRRGSSSCFEAGRRALTSSEVWSPHLGHTLATDTASQTAHPDLRCCRGACQGLFSIYFHFMSTVLQVKHTYFPPLFAPSKALRGVRISAKMRKCSQSAGASV